jgi:hypothetical protein
VRLETSQEIEPKKRKASDNLIERKEYIKIKIITKKKI